MSLLVSGVRFRSGIGVASSRHLTLALGDNYGSAFHTVTSATATTVVGRSDDARFITTVARCGGSRAATTKQPWLPSANGAVSWPPPSPVAALLAQTTRALATDGVEFRDGKPTLAHAKKIPRTFAAMTNDQVLHFAEMGIPEACRECVVRDIMDVDQVEYDEAMKTFQKVAATNREGMIAAAIPFYLGFGAAFSAAFVSVPMVFDLSTVTWFNEHYVTTDLPEPKDLETVLEVGAWSWNWMEPVLGHISFFLLCMQFSRSQLRNLGIRPYFNWQRARRANYLIRSYPQYDAEFLGNFSRSEKLVGSHFLSD